MQMAMATSSNETADLRGEGYSFGNKNREDKKFTFRHLVADSSDEEQREEQQEKEGRNEVFMCGGRVPSWNETEPRQRQQQQQQPSLSTFKNPTSVVDTESKEANSTVFEDTDEDWDEDLQYWFTQQIDDEDEEYQFWITHESEDEDEDEEYQYMFTRESEDEDEDEDEDEGVCEDEEEEYQHLITQKSEDHEEEEYQRWLLEVKQDWSKLRLVPKNFQNNKRIVMAALENDIYGRALKYASPEIQNDREAVMAAIKNCRNGRSLRFASPSLKKDKGFMLEAVRQTPSAFYHASPYLQRDKDILLVMVISNPEIIQYVPEDLITLDWRNDKEFVFKAIEQNPNVIKYIPEDMKRDPDMLTDKKVSLIAVEQNPNVIKYVPEYIKRDPDILIAAGMFDEDHDKKRQRMKITLSTRYALNQSSSSHATLFTKLLKKHQYIHTEFNVYAPNAFDKETCDPNWTDFHHPCRGTKDTCQYNNVLTAVGNPTDQCCWRYSFRYQLEEAKVTGGFMLQLVEREDDETPPMLGNGQTIERDMASELGMKIFHVYRPTLYDGGSEKNFNKRHIEQLVAAIKSWYNGECQDMSECVVRPTLW